MKTNEFCKFYGLHFTTKHTGKMDGMQSLSTSVLENTFCQRRAKCAGSVCAHCYASRMAGMYKNLARALSDNLRVLTTREIPAQDWPLLNVRAFRFEAFGDLMNTTQVRNYFNFATRNAGTTFALWTKNPAIIARAIKAGAVKPKNLIIIQSSARVNVVDQPRYEFIDKVFTVYSKDFIAENAIDINCGARNCLECGRCYKRTKAVEYVNEKLK